MGVSGFVQCNAGAKQCRTTPFGFDMGGGGAAATFTCPAGVPAVVVGEAGGGGTIPGCGISQTAAGVLRLRT